MEELEEEGQGQDQDLRELQEQRFRLKSLTEHPGWKDLMEIAEAQIELRKIELIGTDIRSMDETLLQECRKGELRGVILFQKIVPNTIASLTEQIDELLKLEDKENANEE